MLVPGHRGVDVHHIALVFLAIAIIIVAARLLGRLAIAVGQPPVVGEIAAGIAMGPSLLGLLPGHLDQRLFPPDVLPQLNTLAQLGLVLFMFIVGLELDMSLIRGRERTAGVVSACSVALPFVLALGLGLVIYHRHDTVGGQPVARSALMLFLGVAMAITAFPVLARILTDRRMHRTPVGVLSLACAAVDDILAWSLLAFIVAVVKGDGAADVVRIVALTIVFVGFMFVVVRPLLGGLVGWHRRAGRLTPDILAVVLVGILVSAYLTDLIGIHAIFGAFLFGAVMPRRDAAGLTHQILERLEQVSVLLLLPLFFVVTGLQTNVGRIGLDGLWELGLILLVAIGGKYLAANLAARAMRVPGRQASAIAVLMNTRGLTELVILQIGRELGVLDDALFTSLVLMALITTALTGPLLRRVYPDRIVERDIANAERAALGLEDAYRVVVILDDDDHERDRELLAMGRRMLGGRQRRQVVLTRLIVRSGGRLELGSGIVPDLALMATNVDELDQLAAGLRTEGVAVSAVSRFTADPWDDAMAVARTADAEVVVVGRAWFDAHAGERSAAGERFTIAVVAEPDRPASRSPAGPVVAVADPSAHGRAAVLLAAAIGCADSAEVVVIATGRHAGRVTAALARLSSAGRSIRVIAPDEAAQLGTVAVAIAPRDAGSVATVPPAGISVAVVAGSDVEDADLAEAIGELADASTMSDGG